MKLQPASQKELTNVAIGTAICTVLMLCVFGVLAALQVLTFDYKIPLSAVIGAAVAILNFALLCLTVQGVAGMNDEKAARAKMQASYNGRMMFQTAWCIVAFFLPCFNVFAAALPLLFPRIAIFFRQATAKKESTAAAPSGAEAQPEQTPDGEAAPAPDEVRGE